MYCRIESQGQETTEDVEMKDIEVAIQPEVFEQHKPVEQPAPVVSQPAKTTTSAKRDKKMLSVDERMTEFRDMMLERSVRLTQKLLENSSQLQNKLSIMMQF